MTCLVIAIVTVTLNLPEVCNYWKNDYSTSHGFVKYLPHWL